MAQYFNIAKDIARGYEHQVHNLEFHDADMRKKGWWAQHSFKGLAKSVGSFVEGVTGGESLQTLDAKEEQDLAKRGIRKFMDPTSNLSTRGRRMT